MAQPTPSSLADEIRTTGGAWSLYGARFVRTFGDEASRQPGTWMTIVDGTCCAEVDFHARSPAHARQIRKALTLAGYSASEISQRWFFARRPLRGRQELASETRRLEGIAIDSDLAQRLPHRAARAWASARRTLVPMPTLDFFRDLTGWTWSWAAADRSGRPAFPGDEAQQWRALTWCSLWDLGDGPQLDVGVQAFAGNAGAKEYGRIKRSLLALLEPAGYRALRARARRGSKKPR